MLDSNFKEIFVTCCRAIYVCILYVHIFVIICLVNPVKKKLAIGMESTMTFVL